MTPLFAFFATLFFVGFLGVILGYLLKTLLGMRKREGIETKVARMEQDAQAKASEIITQAEKQSQEVKKQARDEINQQKKDLQENQQRINKKEISPKRSRHMPGADFLLCHHRNIRVLLSQSD